MPIDIFVQFITFLKPKCIDYLQINLHNVKPKDPAMAFQIKIKIFLTVPGNHVRSLLDHHYGYEGKLHP
jgi:hypothetical protein